MLLAACGAAEPDEISEDVTSSRGGAGAGGAAVAGGSQSVTQQQDDPTKKPDEPLPPEPSLALGNLISGEFLPLENGDELSVVIGIQGGRWAMPAATFAHVEKAGELSTSVTLLDGTVLGELSRSVRLGDEGTDGLRMMPTLPIPVRGEEEALLLLDGSEADVAVTFRDGDDQVVSQHLRVVLRMK